MMQCIFNVQLIWFALHNKLAATLYYKPCDASYIQQYRTT